MVSYDAPPGKGGRGREEKKTTNDLRIFFEAVI